MRLSEAIDRRQFLKVAGLTVAGISGAALLGCGPDKSKSGNQKPNGVNSPEQNPDAGLISPEAGWKIYHGEAYEIEFPQDWSAHDTSSDPNEQERFIADGHFSNSESDDKLVYINFSIEKLDPDETTIDDYKDRVIRDILYRRGDEIVGKEEGIQESEGQELLGQPSIELYYTVHYSYTEYPSDKEPRYYDYDQKNLLRMHATGRDVIRLSYSASSDNFEKYKPVFEHMASSIVLK